MKGIKGFIRKCSGWDCTKCGLNFTTRALLALHKKEAHKGEPVQNHYKECFCKFCGRQSTSRSGNTLHEKSCKLNPQRVDGSSKGYKMTEEQKKKISEAQKRNFANGKSRWMLDRSKQSYAEAYFENWLKSFSEFKMNFHVNRFYLDFAWPEKWIYLEIDGEQHFESQQYIERDKKRDEILKVDGWKCIGRIRWSWFKKLSLDEKNKYLNSLKDVILGENIKLESFISDKEIKDTEYQQKINEAKQLGVLTKNGHLHNLMKPFYVWEERKNLILNSGVNLSIYGWKTKVAKVTGLSRRIIDETISHFGSDFDNIFIRKQGHISAVL